jgi:hypothetical protein
MGARFAKRSLDSGCGLRSGLARDLGETANEQAVRLLYAESSLRARNLASVRPDGELIVETALLDLVLSCAFADQSIWLFQIQPDGMAEEVFAYVQGDLFILHHQPEPLLHRFVAAPDQAALVHQVLSRAACDALSPPAAAPFSVSQAALRQAQEAADADDLGSALRALPPDGEAFAAALATPHVVSIFTHLRPGTDGAMTRTQATVLHAASGAWLITEPGDGAMTVEPATTGRVTLVLESWLSAARLPSRANDLVNGETGNA